MGHVMQVIARSAGWNISVKLLDLSHNLNLLERGHIEDYIWEYSGHY